MPLATRWTVLCSAPLLALVALGACSSATSKKGADEAKPDEFAGETRDTAVKHEACDPKGKSQKTAKADDPLSAAKPFVTHVFEASMEVCSFADLNGDGRIDVYTYFDAGGKIRRRESAYGIDKAIDEIATYKDGELVMIARETNFDGRIDTWDYYEGGKLARRERDKNGDNRLDEWWTFEPPGSDNATIVEADPRTGKPDPAQTIKLGVGYTPPPIAGGVVDYKKAKDAGPGKDGAAETSTSPALSPDDVPDAGAQKSPDASVDAKAKKGGP